MNNLSTYDNISVLLVEDNEGDYMLVSEYLAQVFAHCNLVRNTLLSQAATLLSSQKFDIVLLDLSLPDSTGVDSIKEITALADTTPVIVLTGYNDKQFGIDSMKLGVEDYLVKDEVTPAILLKSISYSIERKKNELQIAQSEKRFRALIENSADGLSVINEKGVLLEISLIGKKILGRDIQVGYSMFESGIFFPEDTSVIQHIFLDVLNKPAHPVFAEFRIMLPDGRTRWIENSFHNLLNEPSVKAIVSNFRDITERKIAEEKIRESEEKYRYLFNKNPQAIFIWDPESLKLIDLNDTCVKLYNYTREEFLEKSLLDIRNAEEFNKFNQLAKKMDNGELEIFINTWKHKNKNGDNLYMDITSQRIVFNGRNAVLAIGNNVTEKVLLENELELEKIKKQQEITGAVINAQEKERQEIGSEIHDNVNQILASSKLYIGLAKSNPEKVIPYLNETEKLITSAIKELRNLSHTLIAPSLEDKELIEAIGRIIKTTTRATKISIKSDLKKFNENIYSSKLQLAIYRIVQEQFNNILKYAKAANISICLAPGENGKLVLSIKDDGVGFDTNKKSKGVGLMNIKARASLFNGESLIISSPGNGCELKVVFN